MVELNELLDFAKKCSDFVQEAADIESKLEDEVEERENLLHTMVIDYILEKDILKNSHWKQMPYGRYGSYWKNTIYTDAKDASVLYDLIKKIREKYSGLYVNIVMKKDNLCVNLLMNEKEILLFPKNSETTLEAIVKTYGLILYEDVEALKKELDELKIRELVIKDKLKRSK
jgi:hypothetical protein